MAQREAQLYAKLKARVALATERFERIENGISAGTPDVNYCLDGVEGWIELKAPRAPARASTPLFGSNHPVLTEQINWFFLQHRSGGRGHLLIGTENRLLLLNAVTVAGVGAKINSLTLTQLERIAQWKSPLSMPLVWISLREQLLL